MKTSHFEGRIALSAVETAQGRNERTQCELAAFDFDSGRAWLVAPADCARAGHCHFAGCFHPLFCGFGSATNLCISVPANEHVPFHQPLLQAIGGDDEKEHASYVAKGG